MSFIGLAILAPLVAVQAAISLYLLAMASLALTVRRSNVPTSATMRPRVAVVIPAHNEERLLPRLLVNLRMQTYGRENFMICVVADNCTDATADIVRRFGAEVFERRDLEQPGKGQALAWLIPQLLEADFDAFVLIDADSVVDKDFLKVLAVQLEKYPVLQASYRVLAGDSHALVALRAMAFALMHELRGRAKLRLNLSCGLWGNGMAFQRGVLDLVPWGAFSSVEDAEQHLRLILGGIKVRFVPQVSVYGHMPDTFAAAGDQQTRWEAGRLLLLRRYWRRLARATLDGNGSALVALIELFIPPLSVVLISQVTVTALALALLPFDLSVIAVFALAAVMLYISAAVPLARLQPRSYLALLQAPRFMLWKLQLYFRALVRRGEPAWTRTSREAGRR